MTTGEMIVGRTRAPGGRAPGRSRPAPSEKSLTEADLKRLVRETVNETLLVLGIEHADPKEMQADFIYLRSWRKTMEESRAKVLWTTITIVVTGTGAAIWAGLTGQFR